jgi:hypothetical protein
MEDQGGGTEEEEEVDSIWLAFYLNVLLFAFSAFAWNGLVWFCSHGLLGCWSLCVFWRVLHLILLCFFFVCFFSIMVAITYASGMLVSMICCHYVSISPFTVVVLVMAF